MNNFCTLFDSNFFTRGLALYRSLVASGESFTLYVLCLDEIVYSVLKSIAFPEVVPVCRTDFESPSLLQVKKHRTNAEYCWTCTPYLVQYVLDVFSISEVTYLDADLFFYQKPSLLLDELHAAGSSVLLTKHNFSPELSSDIKFGRYCVQFVTFCNDKRGRKALDWWADRCLEWCYARLEDEKFGDQKYLDDWCQRFEGVYVCTNIGAGVANWNLQQYRLAGVPQSPKVNDISVVFYHFHSVKLYRNGLCDLGYKPLPRDAYELFYEPYLRSLYNEESNLVQLLSGFDKGRLKDRHPLARAISYLLRKPRGIYNVRRLL